MSSAIEHPLVTEKAMNDMDFENKLQFVVNPDATKPEIRDEVEERFEISVENANTQVTMKGKESDRPPLRGGRRTGIAFANRGVLRMGRRIQGQRRGRGTSTFRAPSHRYKADLEHKKEEDDDIVRGTVVDIEHDPARSAPIAAVEFDDGDQRLILAPEGITVGEELAQSVSRRRSSPATRSRSRRFPKECRSVTSNRTRATAVDSPEPGDQCRPDHPRPQRGGRPASQR